MRYNFSRIECYLECPMRYYFKYILRLESQFADLRLANEGHRIQQILTNYWNKEFAFTEEEKFYYRLFDDIGFPEPVTPNKYFKFDIEGVPCMAHLDGYGESSNRIYELKTAQNLENSLHKHRVSYQVPFYAKTVMTLFNLDKVSTQLIVIKQPPQDEYLARKKPKSWYRIHNQIWTLKDVNIKLQPFYEVLDKLNKIDNTTNMNSQFMNYLQCNYCDFKTVCTDNDYFGLVTKETVIEEEDL